MCMDIASAGGGEGADIFLSGEVGAQVFHLASTGGCWIWVGVLAPQRPLDFRGKECILTALHKWYLEAVVSLLLR